MTNRKSAAEVVPLHEVHITARIPRDMHEDLKSIAESQDRTVSAEVRRAIRFYVEQGLEAA